LFQYRRLWSGVS